MTKPSTVDQAQGPKIALFTAGSPEFLEDNANTAGNISDILQRVGHSVETIVCRSASDLQEFMPSRYSLIFIIDSDTRHISSDVDIRKVIGKSGIPYVGASDITYRIARDKYACERLAHLCGFETARSFTLTESVPVQVLNTLVLDIHHLEFPLIVKDNFGSGSIGISTANNVEELYDISKELLTKYSEILVEEFISGTEITVPVVNLNSSTIVLPIAEIRMTDSPYYDFTTKYRTFSNQLLLPAPLSPDMAQAVRDIALTMHKSCSAEFATRTDIIIRNGKPYFLEINGEPVLGQRDFVALCAAEANIDYSTLVLGLVNTARNEFTNHQDPRA